ncbi:MAG TPA: malic enzyme-like NAD(P)-binding protein [Bacillota bacterium]|jgi:malate dehydrogenase (oxaloacetate-decarboxylating)|nr:malic enzyme-like NAD(P)-binding protein [Bacillota bacterium]HQD41878.1 malic enzyme-like NAD(P)-binding protein [Bacillota bacterium]
MTLREDALKLHRDNRGKIEVTSKVQVKDRRGLSLAYTPGVAEPCREIHKDPDKVYEYTSKGNMVAVVTDGTAVLGLGNIGASAALPVMEGKAVLFKAFAGVDAFPICLDTADMDRIVETVALMEPSFGGVNLEDIAAPACFEIERRLKERLSVPVFHDDQHGTAIIVLAALINALKITGKQLEDLKVVINGVGAAGVAIGKIVLRAGAGDLIMCDSRGIIYSGRTEGMNPAKEEMAGLTNKDNKKGSLADALAGADVFIGVSSANLVSADMIKGMNSDPIVFALANPVPEIDPDVAKEAGARIVGTGRSDYPNQINNVLAFPGVFRGALDVRATDINEEMKLAAAYALAGVVAKEELNADYIIPKPFDPRVAPAVAEAVARAAMDSGVARVKVDPEKIAQRTKEMLEKTFS